VRFTSLAHLLTPEFLTETWGMMNRRAASGIDGEQLCCSPVIGWPQG
jgi:RNA-directed DNA polymerase